MHLVVELRQQQRVELALLGQRWQAELARESLDDGYFAGGLLHARLRPLLLLELWGLGGLVDVGELLAVL